MKKFIQSPSIFLFLLPAFFVFHGFVEYFPAVSVADASYLLLLYAGVTAALWGLAWLFYRNARKAAIFSFSAMAFHFFFGAFHDLLKKYFDNSFFTRYSVLLPLFLMIFVLLFIWLKRTKHTLSRVSLYLNLLMLIFLLSDAARLLQSSARREQPAGSVPLIHCDTCTKPDIYLLLFDEYSSSKSLRENWNFDNSGLDSFLVQSGFRIQSDARSNYNMTQFSMAALLNMDYVPLANPDSVTIYDYTRCYELIRKNRVCEMLETVGYRILNYSIFDLKNNPSRVAEDFLPLRTKLITSQTFLSRVRRDLFYHLVVGKFRIPGLASKFIYITGRSNRRNLEATLAESRRVDQQPRFVYTHIKMPHPPYYYDGEQEQTDLRKLIQESASRDVEPYLRYIPRTNQVVQELVRSIQKNAGRPVVILFLSDHGFRVDDKKSTSNFDVQSAVYASHHSLDRYYANISGVNHFRVLFTELFRTPQPLLRDSTSFLTDK